MRANDQQEALCGEEITGSRPIRLPRNQAYVTKLECRTSRRSNASTGGDGSTAVTGAAGMAYANAWRATSAFNWDDRRHDVGPTTPSGLEPRGQYEPRMPIDEKETGRWRNPGLGVTHLDDFVLQNEGLTRVFKRDADRYERGARYKDPAHWPGRDHRRARQR